MIPSVIRKGRPLDWAAGIVIPVLCAGVVLAQQPPPPVAATTDKAPPAAAPNPKSVAAVELDKKIMAEIKDHSEIMKNLEYISDVIGPRLTGSSNLEKANKWTAEKMKEYGLENVHLEPWEIPMGWERGTARLTLKEPQVKELMVASYAWAPGTKGKVTGPVVLIETPGGGGGGRFGGPALTREDLAKYKGKLKDAVVITGAPGAVGSVIDGDELRTITGTGGGGRRGGRGGAPPGGAPTPPPAETPPAKKGDEPQKAVAKETAQVEQPPAAQPPAGGQPPVGGQPPQRPMGGGFGGMSVLNDFLKEEGAAAVLIDSGKPQGLLNMTGSWGGRGGAEPTIPEDGLARLFITHDHLTLLYRLIKEQKITPIVEVEVTNKFVKGPITVYNTIGDIKGSEKPDEIVVLGAHLDSWDLGTGTTDNGTGSSVVLECARVLGKLAKEGVRPNRTIRCILFTGEEEGLHGSKQYCIKHKDEMAKHDACLVHDTGTGKVNNFGALGRVKVMEILANQLESLKEVGFNGLIEFGMAGGTDHASFNAVSVPGFACGQDPDEYRWTHHTQTDTFDKAKGPNLVQGAQVMCVTAVRIANLPEMLPREAGAGRGGFGGGGGRRGGGQPPATDPPAGTKPPDKKGG
jgi:hypothetical protein